MPESEVVRKLTTIMAADVVGYSRLMTDDEEGTLRIFRGYRKIIDALIKKHGGRIFNTAGDAVLAEFNSAVEGVRCTISIQEELATRNAELPEDRRLMLRIGINIGDVMINGDDLMGDGVNVAARLEGLAPPGGICISTSTFEQVKNKLSIGFQDLGPQEVKNIPYPVGAFKIMPGPVSVIPDQAEAVRPSKRRLKLSIFGASTLLVVAITASVIGFLIDGEEEEKKVNNPSAILSTDRMTADDIRLLVGGLTIHGKSDRTGGDFTIQLKQDGQASLVMEPGDKLGIRGFRETGKWWANDRQFCIQFTRFAFGEPRCPSISQHNDRLVARRRNGEPLEWSFSPGQ